ncbi:NYN domain-containing protein [Patescibacteria group bacterium]|nr:NYN domain-containing protein [Patescibacteria group bacterium]
MYTKPLKEIRDRGNIKAHHRKANFDVEIAVDALSKRGLYKNLILFSGDSDFDYLVKYLRKAEKKVVVISLKHHISRELIESADFYMDLKKIRKFIERKQ